MLMTMVMVFTMIPEEAFAYGNEDACIANGHGDNWVWVKDGNSHHHKHCYTCGLDFDYDECYVEWTQNDGNTHYGRCKQCHYFTTGPQIHNKDGRTTIVLPAYDVNGNFMKKVSHTNVPCCSVCGYVNPVDAHDYGLVYTYDKKPDGGLESSCCVECKTCGDVSPYYNHDTRGHFQIGALHNNYSYHWAVCDICGSTFDYEYHDWVYESGIDPQTGRAYKTKYCRDMLCRFNPMYHLPDKEQSGHKHEWEYKSAGAGYHRQWCKKCGMPNGPAEKCTGTYTKNERLLA